MQTKFEYWVWQSVIPKETCQKIINRGLEQLDLLTKEGFNPLATTFGNNQKSDNRNISQQDLTAEQLKEKNISENNVYVRDSNISWLSDEWIYKILYNYVAEANIKAGWNYEFDWSEPAQFTIYNKNQFYGWHSDGLNDNFHIKRRKIPGVYDEKHNNDSLYTPVKGLVGKVRKLSITVMLSDPKDYDGGKLKFDFGVHASGDRYKEITDENIKQGSIVVFPSYKYHCVTPVTRGTRYSLVVWYNGRPMK